MAISWPYPQQEVTATLEIHPDNYTDRVMVPHPWITHPEYFFPVPTQWKQVVTAIDHTLAIRRQRLRKNRRHWNRGG